ncbi:MAG: dTMP kinase [Terrimicrobiaceae bacterium]
MTPEKRTGFFLSFEGSEGCGKSTQIRRLVAVLENRRIPHLLVREPGGTAAGEVIRNLLQHSDDGNALVPEAELLLFAASRAQLVREVILPALEEGKLVVSDRFLDSTTVYQGVARQLPASEVEMINRFAAGPRLPDRTILLDMDPAMAFARVRGGRAARRDRMEELPESFYRDVREGYLAVAASDPARFRVLDASRSEDELAGDIWEVLIQTGHAIFQGNRA